MMIASSVIVDVRPGYHYLVIDSRDQKNALSLELIERIRGALHNCECDAGAKALIIAGNSEFFCNGLDLAGAGSRESASNDDAADFVGLLDHMTSAEVVVVASIAGHTRGGGVGLIAACDFAFAQTGVEFALPELLWGLLPCTIAPFVIRRIGPRAFRTMTLSTLPLSAAEACALGLVDSLESDALPRLLRRLKAIPRDSIGQAKRYLNAMTPIEPALLDFAVAELRGLLDAPDVRDRLAAFAATGRFPWELQRHGA